MCDTQSHDHKHIKQSLCSFFKQLLIVDVLCTFFYMYRCYTLTSTQNGEHVIVKHSCKCVMQIYHSFQMAILIF